MNVSGAWTFSAREVRRGERAVLADIDIRVVSGAVTALIGPNGAGKSTLLRALAGLEGEPRSVRLPDGRSFASLERVERARHVAWAGAQAQFAFAFDVLSVVLMGRFPWHGGHPGERDRERAHAELAALDAGALAARPVTSLSSGECQKVALARVLASDAPLLLLDEPTSNLDLDAALRLIAALRGRAASGHAVVVCMHDLALAHRHADRVVCLSQGTVAAAGETGGTLTPELVRRHFGVPAELLYDAAGVARLALGP